MDKSKILVTIILAVLCLAGCAHKDTEIVDLQTNYLVNPMGIDETCPEFSWKMISEQENKSQSAYQIILVEGKENFKEKQYVWDSGKVESDLSVAIPYEGPTLKPLTEYYWKVNVWDEQGKLCKEVEEATFETGVLGKFFSEAHWLTAPKNQTSNVPYTDVVAYTIDYTIELQNTSACFAFGAEDGNYGCITLCEISANDQEAFFAVKDMDELNSNIEFPTEQISLSEDGKYNVHLQVEDSCMNVRINDAEIGTFEIPSKALGAIGYYKSRGTEYAYLDDISVISTTGTNCYEEHFDEENSIFSPQYIKTVDGRLEVSSGILLTDVPEDPAPVFQRTFSRKQDDVVKARVYMTSLGNFHMTLNGQEISNDVLAPGKLAYNQYLSYVTYDVTNLLQKDNVWETTLFHGWYDTGVGYPEIYNPWGEKNAICGALVITYQDGTEQIIGTDEDFRVTLDGPIRENDLYQGEVYDASRELLTEDVNWEMPLVDDVDAMYMDMPLVGKENEPIRCVEELIPIAVTEPVAGTYVYDFGQNFAGVCQVQMNAKEGDVITLRYAEALNTENLLNADDEPGTVWTENLLTADATDYYIARDGEQTYRPISVYHGFRYLQITGLSEEPSLYQVKGMVLSSDLEQTGDFECSEKLVNQYWSNTFWSQLSNSLDNPTDCPQRDERHGWTGDAQIFSKVGCYNRDSLNYYKKYLTELRCLQSEDGAFPDMAPRNFGTNIQGKGGAGGNNCWGDAAVVISWNLYLQYGDLNVLEDNYEALSKWVNYLENHSENGLRNGEESYGDHFSIESTPKGLTDTAWSAHSADIVAQMAEILGKKEDAAHYQEVFESFRSAWLREYVSEDGIIECYSQTAYALGLAFDLFPDDVRAVAAECLANNISFNQNEFHAGYAGMCEVLPALSDAGLSDIAYALLLNTNEKSLLYPITQGATTTTEYLSAYRSMDGKQWLDGSLNHCAYGAPAAWLYTNLLGIQGDVKSPGFKHFVIKPEVNAQLSYAKGSYNSVYGRIEVLWEKTETGYRYEVCIPANTTATVMLPGVDTVELGSGKYQFEANNIFEVE